ncbi:MAG: hypothetical protein SFY67_06965 [Candidatus Melainabacteria bacterium]|nr:hypothetical protein [Candidatus Melainabacteria bacterium]
MHSLKIQSQLPQQAIIEFVALCVAGWVTGNEIKSSSFRYTVETTDDWYHISIDQTSKKAFTDLTEELLMLLLGLATLTAHIEIEGHWSNEDRIRHAYDWTRSHSNSIPQLSQSSPIHPLSNLTLDDLIAIHELLNKSNDFASLFPFCDLYDSSHGSLRHFKGNECYVKFEQNKAPITHKIDSPNPADLRFDQWLSALENRTAPKAPKFNAKSKGYFKSANDRWKIAKMLGEIPGEHKSRVFAFVNDVINTVNEYHDTRGSQGPLPERFEIAFDHMKLIANPELVFKIE